MGVPLLFKWLKDNYPECLLQILGDQTLEEAYAGNGFINSEGKRFPEEKGINIDSSSERNLKKKWEGVNFTMINFDEKKYTYKKV